MIAGADDRIALVGAAVVAQVPAGATGRALGDHAIRRAGIELRTPRSADRGRARVPANTVDIARAPPAVRVTSGRFVADQQVATVRAT